MYFPSLADIPAADIDGRFHVHRNDEIALFAFDDRLVLVIPIQLELGFPFAGHGELDGSEFAEFADERQFEDAAELRFWLQNPFVVLINADDTGDADREVDIDDEENAAFDPEHIEDIDNESTDTQAEIEIDLERNLQAEQSFESDGDFPRAMNLPFFPRFGSADIALELFPAQREV